MDNIAEGFERDSKREFIHSLTIAKGEVGELKSQLYRGWANQYFTPTLFDELYEMTNRLTKMLTAFISYLNQSNISGQKFKKGTNT
jgi:four helix bundle protein